MQVEEIIARTLRPIRHRSRYSNIEDAAEIIAALDAAGYVIAPKEPGIQMIEAGREANWEDWSLKTGISRVYRAMLAARPDASERPK